MLTDRELIRYERQILFRPLGRPGQERLKESSVVVCGVGALGTACASMLARAGIGNLRLVDFDAVELSNLQRQALYDEDDVAQRRPKAQVAAEKLGRVNSDIAIAFVIEKITRENAAELTGGVDVIIDAVDNFAAKFALNAAAVASGTPLIYGALSGSYGLCMPILPGETACLCCLYREQPDAGSSETAATAGVIAPTVNTVASLQVAQTLKLLAGAREELTVGLSQIDLWDGEFDVIPVSRRADCRVCGGAVQ